MKQTNYTLFDFLDFDTALPGGERLWKVGCPIEIKNSGKDVVLTLPFRKQKNANDIEDDPESEPRYYSLYLRAYGSKILRTGIAFDGDVMPDSPMLDMEEDLEHVPLEIEKREEEWLVKDAGGTLRAQFNLAEPATDPWSDLVPGPGNSLEAIFYPDGEKAIRISAYDQFFPARVDAFAMAFVEKRNNIDRCTVSFHAHPDEKFSGTGERFAKMDLSGRSFRLNNQDGQGVNSRRCYKNIPFFLSSRKYGVFMHTSAYGKISLADHSTRSVQLLNEDKGIDLFLIGGDRIEEILFEYRRLTGFPSLPPRWSFGTWMSRMSYFSAEEVREICRRLRKEDYPCDVIHLDTGWFRTDWLCEWKFSEERFPEPEKFIRDLRKDGYKISLWQMPYIAYDAEQYEEALENRYIGESESGKRSESNFSALDNAGTIDFTNLDATNWYKKLIKDLLDMGVVCIKTDFGEDIHMNARYHNMEPEKLNNLYALLYQKAAFEITKEVTGDGIVWARAGWAGCQRYPVHWGGDAASSWDGMAGSLKGGLHLGLSGFAFWSHDVPGFHGVPDFMNSVIPDDLYVRWTQFGVFSSHIRYHGTSKREPYDYPAIADIVRRWWKLRYALLPYILEQSEKCTKSGYSMIRPLLMHHPEDKMCWHIDDQYYFGDHFLVAPVMNSDNIRDVYLPEGSWIDFFTGEQLEGGRWLEPSP